MKQYYYFPVLKTRPSEILAYENLSDSIKEDILPIIEMTGALGYTYPKNYKIKNLQGTKRPGDISKKRKKILDLMENKKFILDITDDDSLKYYGLSENSGDLLDHSNGYQAWINFLTVDEQFRKQVIPTIQFNTNYVSDLLLQISTLANMFDYIAIKLPIFLSSSTKFDSSVQFNSQVQNIIDLISQQINIKKLILILDFGYISNFSKYEQLIKTGISYIKDVSKLKAVIPLSSSYPNFVVTVKKPIEITENMVSSLVIKELKSSIGATNIYHGDFAGIHPTKYEMGGGGWIPRIDYIVRDIHTKEPKQYDYFRGEKRNTSTEYQRLANQVNNAPNYLPITEISAFGDTAILKKCQNTSEGKVPSYWIAVRSNLYMTMECLYLKQRGSFLVL